MTRGILPALLLLILTCVAQENPIMRKYANMIDSVQMRDNLSILASDALEGRYTGSRGQKMAAAFIANHFRENGLEAPVNGSYFQPVRLYSTKVGDAYVIAGGIKHDNFTNVFYSGSEETSGEVKADVVFAGQGRAEDFAQVDLKGKSVLLWAEKLTFGTSTQLRLLATKARSMGARYVFIVFATQAEYQNAQSLMKRFQSDNISLEKPDSEKTPPGRFYVSPAIAEKFMNAAMEKLNAAATADPSKNALKKIKTGSLSLQISQMVSEVNTENVLGYLPGTDKKDELVVVTAHFDHIGKRSAGDGDVINNGADDDGSGTVAVMQMAKVFAKAKRVGDGPRRSMLFMTFTAEEQGKLGSEYYVNNPVFPLTNTVANLNIDMIGRADDKYEGNKKYVYVIGSDKLSTDLHSINENVNSIYTQLKFDYTYNEESHPERIYYRSDHWNFAKNNIPIIFYFNGTHGDYHRVTDEISKIDFSLLTTRAQCVFYTAWEIANRDQRLKVDKK